jgi:hypothetical protein
MVAIMGDVFAFEYNFHVPLYFEGQVVHMRGWLYVTMFFFLLLVCWLFLILWFIAYSGFSIGVYLFFLRRSVVWCVSAAGGVFACFGVTVCRVLSRLCPLL